MNKEALVRRRDGKYEEDLGDNWTVEYSENRDTGLWEAEVFKHNVPEWHGVGYESLEDARAAALNFYEQS